MTIRTKLTRRDLAGAGALAFGAAALLTAAPASAEDEAGVKDALEALRQAIIKPDKAKLDALAADQVSYGHSSGVVQTKAEMIEGYLTRQATLKTLEFPELKLTMAGTIAITRHLYVSQSELDGKVTD